MTTYLNLTPDQSAQLARDVRVETWERMQPQPEPQWLHAEVDALLAYLDGNIGISTIQRVLKMGFVEASRVAAFLTATPPHPPGTRATVNTGTPTQAGGVTVRVGAIVRLTATSCTPERRDEWGWLTVWQHEGSK